MLCDTSNELEKLMDRCGLESVLNQLAEIASAKAEHVETTYLDVSLAADWSRASQTFVEASERIPEAIR